MNQHCNSPKKRQTALHLTCNLTTNSRKNKNQASTHLKIKVVVVDEVQVCFGVRVGVAADAAIRTIPDDAAVRTIALQLTCSVQLVPLALSTPKRHDDDDYDY